MRRRWHVCATRIQFSDKKQMLLQLFPTKIWLPSTFHIWFYWFLFLLVYLSGKDHENARRTRRTIKKVWSKDEVAAVMRHFKLHIAKGNLATKSECQHCKLVEGKVLDERTVQNVRDFVRNRGISRKRQSQSQWNHLFCFVLCCGYPDDLTFYTAPMFNRRVDRDYAVKWKQSI